MCLFPGTILRFLCLRCFTVKKNQPPVTGSDLVEVFLALISSLPFLGNLLILVGKSYLPSVRFCMLLLKCFCT